MPGCCPRCAGQAYRDYDGDWWCLACGESCSAPARLAGPLVRWQVARDRILDDGAQGTPVREAHKRGAA